jgi:hypothetical protein
MHVNVEREDRVRGYFFDIERPEFKDLWVAWQAHPLRSVGKQWLRTGIRSHWLPRRSHGFKVNRLPPTFLPLLSSRPFPSAPPVL